MSVLADELGIHRSLASKFRSGNEFPKIAHLARLAGWTGDHEFVLAAIAHLDLFEPVRRNVSTWITQQRAGHLDPPEPDSGTRDDQVRRRLVESGLLVGDRIRHGAAIVAVADGHGVTTVTRRINVHAGPGQGATECRSPQRGVTGLQVVPSSGLSGHGPQTSVFHVPSPSWADLQESIYGATPSRPLDPLRQELIDEVPLQVVLAALRAFHITLIEPTQLWPIEPSPKAASALRQASKVDLTEAQDEQLNGLDDQSVWAVIVDDEDVGLAVAERVLHSRSATTLIGAPSSLAQALQLLSRVEGQKPARWLTATTLLPDPGSAAAGAPVLVDLALNGAGDADLGRAALRRLIELLVPLPGGTAAWYLVGTEAQVRSATMSLAVPVRVISVIRPDLVRSPAADAPAVDYRRRLPGFSARQAEAVARQYVDIWNLHELLGALAINAVVEFPPGQGGSAAARAVMSWRYERDMRDHSGQRLLSLEQALRTDDAARLLKVHGFSDDWQRADDDRTVAAPFLRTATPMAPAERLRAAEEVSAAVMQISEQMIRPGRNRHGGAIYLDLTATPFGRVPASPHGWNETEALTETYKALARRTVEAFENRPSVFVFAPRGALDVVRFNPLNWQHVPVGELTRDQLDLICSSHDLSLPPRTPTRLLSSIATWDWSSSPRT